jgi:hypothetical protein
MKATFEASPSPNQTRNIGRNASGGMGRTNSTMGSTRTRSGAQTPTTRPRPSAAAAASPKPWATRPSEVRRCVTSSPLPSSRAAESATSIGVGSSTGLTMPSQRLP